MLNSIVWAAHLEVPKEGVVSPQISLEELNANLNRPHEEEVIPLPTAQLFEFEPGVAPELGPNGRAVSQKKKK